MGPIVTIWDSFEPKHENIEAESHPSGARAKELPDTFHHTRWHLDAQHDIDTYASKQQHLNTATRSTSHTARGVARLPAAGRPSGMPTEGCALPWYEKVRAAEVSGAPHSAR